jgi:hypothetical protein
VWWEVRETGQDGARRISGAYSQIVRSLQNRPDAALFRIGADHYDCPLSFTRDANLTARDDGRAATLMQFRINQLR